jgi:glycosyltransferase involved in cell wall biosynthesis
MPGHDVAIVLPHREVFSPGAAGAIAGVVARLAAAPSAHHVHVLGRGFAGDLFPGIAFHPVDPGPRLLGVTQSYLLGLLPVLRRLPPGPIEVHNKPDLARWLARLFPRRPVSLFLHNDPRTMRGSRSPAARRRLLDRLAGVATVSVWLRDALLDGVDPPPRRMPVVIHNALDPAALPAPLPPGERDRTILFAGRIVPDKAPDAFVAACAQALPQLPGWRAQLVGADGFAADGPETGFIRALRPIAAAAGVEWLGHLPPDAVLRAMSRAAIVVVPSRWQEPFGLTALEAMMCGAALVCSRRGGLAEIAGEACVGFDPDRPDAAGLIALAQDPARLAALAAAGLNRAKAQFGLADAVLKLEEFRKVGALPQEPLGSSAPRPA